VSAPLKLQATIRDDGLPKPRIIKQATPEGTFGAQIDRPAAAVRGLTLSWIQYGGPAKAVFESGDATPVTNGQTSTTVRFTQPGTYKLRAIANDGELSTNADVVVSVR